MKKRTLYVILAFVLIAFVLAACGGGGEATSNEFTVTVVNEFGFDPNSITVKAGDTITVNFENTGAVEHNLNIVKPEAELDHLIEEIQEGAGHGHVDEELLTNMHDTEPGHTEAITFTAPSEPGEYSFICTTPGHAAAGMVGTIVVVP
jgi:plastocyanin